MVVDKRHLRELLLLISTSLGKEPINVACTVRRKDPDEVRWYRLTESGFALLGQALIPPRVLDGESGTAPSDPGSNCSMLRIADDYVAALRNFSWNGPDRSFIDLDVFSKESTDAMKTNHSFDLRLLGKTDGSRWPAPFLEWWIVAEP
jgi:hypothetical protein